MNFLVEGPESRGLQSSFYNMPEKTDSNSVEHSVSTDSCTLFFYKNLVFPADFRLTIHCILVLFLNDTSILECIGVSITSVR